MKTVKRKVIEEFHYLVDGKNPVRQPVGSMAEIRTEDVQKLVDEGKIEGDPVSEEPATEGDEASPQRRKRGK